MCKNLILFLIVLSIGGCTFLTDGIELSTRTGADPTVTVTLDEVHMYLLPGESAQLSVVVSPSDIPVLWSTADSLIASVDQNGTVTAAAQGKTVISASAGTSAYDTCEITVIPDGDFNTFYLAVDGDDTQDGSSGLPWATFSHAFDVMESGDTLIVRDGVYAQQVRNIPSGYPGHYTYVKAETDFGVTIDGAWLPDYDRTLFMNDSSYVHVQGLKFKSNRNKTGGGPCLLEYSDHIKLIRCAFFDAPDSGNIGAAFAASGCTYILFEECFAYGGGRYKFAAYSDTTELTEKIIFRRCVARHDYHDYYGDLGNLCSTFTSYDCHDVQFQNCISIDSGVIGDNAQYETLYGRVVSGLNWVCKDTHPQDISGKVLGCIFLNIESYTGAIRDPKNNGEHIIENTVIWDSLSGYYSNDTNDNQSGSLLLDHMTIGGIWGYPHDDLKVSWGTGVYNGYNFGSGLQTVTNSLIQGCNSSGLMNYLESDYNVFHGNGTDYRHAWGIPEITAGAHDVFADPGLKYICRPAGQVILDGKASDGGDIGATIEYRYGVSGTLWGEEGYDRLTDEPLWPFPNEDAIKTQMSTWEPPAGWAGPSEYDGRRGFCADGDGLYGGPITLTSYIWEYLGNPCPADFYD